MVGALKGSQQLQCPMVCYHWPDGGYANLRHNNRASLPRIIAYIWVKSSFRLVPYINAPMHVHTQCANYVRCVKHGLTPRMALCPPNYLMLLSLMIGSHAGVQCLQAEVYGCTTMYNGKSYSSKVKMSSSQECTTTTVL